MHKEIKNIFHEDQVLAEAAMKYGFSNSQVRFLADAENYVYECIKDNQSYILKITHTIRRSSDYIMGEKEFPIMEVKVRVHKNRYTTDVYYDIKDIEGVVGVKCDTL